MKQYEQVTVTCDGCGATAHVPIVEIDANLIAWLPEEHQGWRLTDGKDYCPKCDQSFDADS
jgi:hypothetical protein